MKNINVLMLGGKRCGKTTVLSSMYAATNVVLAGTGLSINVDAATQAELNKARVSIINRLKEFENPLTSCEVDDNPSSAARKYSFSLKRDMNVNPNPNVKVNDPGIPFTIYDIPGEWLTNENASKVTGLIKECQVIIIAIDTPYLFAKMTDKGYGQYHEKYNKSIEITNFFKNTLTADDLKDRMILFVPIKCERYYHLDRSQHLRDFGRRYMSEIATAVGAGYRDLILHLRSCSELVNHCTIAITPILSAGGIDFISFREDPKTGRMVSYYQAPEFLSASELGYRPKFCEQPMIYMLAYLLLHVYEERIQMQQMQQQQRNSASLFQFGRTLSGGMTPQQMQEALLTLKKKMKRNTGVTAQDDGYLFIQNPKNL